MDTEDLEAIIQGFEGTLSHYSSLNESDAEFKEDVFNYHNILREIDAINAEIATTDTPELQDRKRQLETRREQTIQLIVFCYRIGYKMEDEYKNQVLELLEYGKKPLIIASNEIRLDVVQMLLNATNKIIKDKNLSANNTEYFKKQIELRFELLAKIFGEEPAYTMKGGKRKIRRKTRRHRKGRKTKRRKTHRRRR